MTLPPHCLNALVRLKAEMLLRESVMITLESVAPVTERAREPRGAKRGDKGTPMRHAKRPNSFQRMCQRRDWASPIY